MSSNLKNVQFNGVVQKNINKNAQYNDEEVPMDEEKPLKSSINPNTSYEHSVLTTMSSEEDINMKGLLDISNTSKNENMTSSDDFAVSKSKENNAQPTFSQEYFDEIYENLLLDEARFNQKVNSNYMSFQKSINYKMRAILVDWIIDVHNRCNMKKDLISNYIHH